MPAGAPSLMPVLLGAASLLGSVGLVFASFSRLKLWRRIADTPTSRIRSAALGLVELKGLAQALGQPLQGPFSGTDCCWWRISVEQEETRQTKNGTRREWRQIHSAASEAPFRVVEQGASVTVLPAGADIDGPKLVEHVRGGGGILGLAQGWLRRVEQGSSPDLHLAALPGPATPQWIGGGLLAPRRRLREWRIDPDRPLYALGALRHQPGMGSVLAEGRQGEPFIISTGSEEELLSRYRWQALGLLATATAALVLGLWLLRLGLAASVGTF